MEIMTLSEHLTSVSGLFFTVSIALIEILSLLFLALVVHEYRKTISKHYAFPAAIEHDLELLPQRGVTWLFWIYVVLTVLVVIATSFLFLFQPHLL